MAPGSTLKSVSRMNGSPLNCGYACQNRSRHQLMLHGAKGLDGSCVLLEAWNSLVLVPPSILD